jgi:hypothetical protein
MRDSLGRGTESSTSSKPQGYGLYWKGKYWGSLSTGPLRPDGTHDLYLGVVGQDTHQHVWVRVAADVATGMGTQLKDQGRHIGTGAEADFTTQAVARVSLAVDQSGRIITTLADVFKGSAVSAQPAATTRDSSRRQPTRVDLKVPDAASAVDCEFAVVQRGSVSASSASTSGPVFLPFSDPSPLGMTMKVARWSPGS